MRCSVCYKEFGNGEYCQYCGTDRVTGLGNYYGYSAPDNNSPNSPAPIPQNGAYNQEVIHQPIIVEEKSIACYACGEIIPADSKFCPHCSINLYVICPQCGHEYSSQYPACNQCGTNRKRYEEDQIRIKKEKTYEIPYGTKSIMFSVEKDYEYIIIPNSVKNIGDFGFSECTSLKEILIPNSVNRIGNKAFYDCKSLKKAYIPDSVGSIGEGAFCGCESLEEIKLPPIKKISEDLFSLCKSISKCAIPSSVIEIGRRSFFGCESLEEIVIPDSVTTIRSEAFGCCSSLKRVVIPNSLKCIEDGAFEELYLKGYEQP